MKRILNALMLASLFATGCNEKVVVDTGPIGGGLSTIALGLVLAAWVLVLFK